MTKKMKRLKLIILLLLTAVFTDGLSHFYGSANPESDIKKSTGTECVTTKVSDPGGDTIPATSEQMSKMKRLIHTNDAQLNKIVENIFSQCIISKLFGPLPPALPNKWFSPGGGYVGQWIWDTQFVLAAYAPMGEDSVIRGVYDNYWQTIENNPEAPRGSYRFGMVPNFLKEWPPLGYSQIPILAWGVLEVYRQNYDRLLLEQALPYLLAFDEWYSLERDVDNDGLIEFGAYKPIGNAGMVQTARYETFDFFPPMDDMKLTKHPSRQDSGEWYGNVEGVEQTCFLLMHEQAIAEIALELGKDELAGQYRKIIDKRIDALQSKMWDPEKRFFYSLDRDTDQPIEVRCIQGFLTLCCDAATKEQAEILVSDLMDPAKWLCMYPVPTVAIDDPKFDEKGFWRGDMWPVTTSLVAYGLNKYGYHKEAGLLTDRIVELTLKYGINERYNGVTGQPLGVSGLGMSCSIWLMIVENYYGIFTGRNSIVMPQDAAGRQIRIGNLEVNYPSDNLAEIKSDADRKITFTVPSAPSEFSIRCNGKKVPGKYLVVNGGSVSFSLEKGKMYTVSFVTRGRN